LNTEKSVDCQLPLTTLKESFEDRWGRENNQIRPNYHIIDENTKNNAEQNFSTVISEDDIISCIKYIK